MVCQVTPDIMLARLDDEVGADMDEEDSIAVMDKFMKDLTNMIEGMLDLQRRWELLSIHCALSLSLSTIHSIVYLQFSSMLSSCNEKIIVYFLRLTEVNCRTARERCV